ncbi:multidrug resistance-associated protein 1-like isoform X3 [Tachypleus tridentatus]|uniref:multidrug resistance-associated protein 1-like isoform X3 n=1 Tax=Tachypleus tridentatus TaxID=6853 RepID=UPI003FCF7DEA
MLVKKAFCTSPLWDLQTSWYTDWPDLTPCFQQTILIYVPCGFLWLAVPVELFRTRHMKDWNPPWTLLNIVKFVANLLLFGLSSVETGASIKLYVEDNGIPVAHMCSNCVESLTFILACYLLLYEKRKQIMSSGTFVTFWFFLTLCGAVSYRSVIHQVFYEEYVEIQTFHYKIEMIYFPLVFSQLCLSSFTDRSYVKKSKKDFPRFEDQSFLSWLTFSWIFSIVYKGFKRPLVLEDMPPLSKAYKAETTWPQLDKYWTKELLKINHSDNTEKELHEKESSEKNKKQCSLVWALFRGFWKPFVIGTSLDVIYSFFLIVPSILLNFIISFVSSDQPLWQGIFYACLLFSCSLCGFFCTCHVLFLMFETAIKIKTALITAVYRKSLVLSSAARCQYSVGELVNLMAVDAEKVFLLAAFITLLVSCPVRIILAIILLWQYLGFAALMGVGVMLAILLLTWAVLHNLNVYQAKQMKEKDVRLKIMNEILSGIKVLKLYAWEPPFMKQIMDIRSKELKYLKRFQYLNAITSFLWSSSPFLITIFSFVTYLFMDEENVLDPNTAFVSVTLFTMLRFSLITIPDLVSYLVQTRISLKRLKDFLICEELDESVIGNNTSKGETITMDKGSFSWSKEGEPVLKNVSLHVKKGQLVAIVGQVGSGKSSLLSAILGEMYKTDGTVNVQGTTAYVAQQAWIQNATLKQNILFLKEMNNSTYQRIINACSLIPDLSVLPAGDLTEIGEKKQATVPVVSSIVSPQKNALSCLKSAFFKALCTSLTHRHTEGVNLSGGQKQRVSLARAVYQDKDIYLFDDPLSAVDSHVAKHIFQHVIGPYGILKAKTRVLVTHNLSVLPEVDFIVVLKDGHVLESGSCTELLLKGGSFAEFVKEHGNTQDDNSYSDECKHESLISTEISKLSRESSIESAFRSRSHTSGSSAGSVIRERSITSEVGHTEVLSGGGLTQDEKMEVGRVKNKVYLKYLKSWTVSFAVITVSAYISSYCFELLSKYWLSAWVGDKPLPDGSQDIDLRNWRLTVYGLLGLSQTLFFLLSKTILFTGAVRASRVLHHSMLQSVMRAPMCFFDTTPMGRTLNRFGKDIDVVDIQIPLNFDGWIDCLLQVLSTIIIISVTNPVFIAAVIPIGLIYVFIQKLYIGSSRQLKRIESVTRSPIYNHFSETLNGTSTIRAFSAQEFFINQSNIKMDLNQNSFFLSLLANRWLTMILYLLGSLISFFTALFAVLSRGWISPGIVGLTLSYAVNLPDAFIWVVRITSGLETKIVSVERIDEFSVLPSEASWEIEDQKPSKQWPAEGKVSFQNYSTRYREGLDLVLKDINMNIKSAEKIGVVGRTGAGKSSLTLSLFRIIEAAFGSIYIDEHDISTIGLHDLRSKLAVIPQDPVLFTGTLRVNLDPNKEFTDEQLWNALEHSHLKPYVISLSERLEHHVAEGGENLSVGQRQLICLARALLRKTKVLVLDEATAAVDLDTDRLIQNTIRNEFSQCTIITIAHRLNTIMDYDRVIIMDQGKIIETGPPKNLLAETGSVFYGMARDAGLA